MIQNLLRVIATEGVPVEATDGDNIQAWADLFGRLVLAGYNPAVNGMNVQEIAPATLQTFLKDDYAQFTAVGNSVGVEIGLYHYHTFVYTVAAIDTNVVIRIEGSIDGTN